MNNKQKSEWIKTTDRMPGLGEWVLIIQCEGTTPDIAFWVDPNNPEDWFLNYQGTIGRPTHWMPLPLAPKEEP